MKKLFQKIIVFLCATLFLLIGAGCWGEGGGLGKTAEERGRERFNQIPAAVYTIDTRHENGWLIFTNKEFYTGDEIEITSEGKIIAYETAVHTLGSFRAEEEEYYEFELNSSSGGFNRARIYKSTKHLSLVDL